MRPVTNGSIFMQMIFLSRRPLSPSLCLCCLSADKRKRMPILFSLPRGSFFPSAVTAAPNLSPLLFSRAHPLLLHLISSACAPFRLLLSCENGVTWLHWFVWTVSPLNLISFGWDCWSPRQQVLITLRLHIYFCSTVDICKRGTFVSG